MTALDKVTALVEAHVQQDHARFRAVTLQIAAALSARGHSGADHLRELVEKQRAVVAIRPDVVGLLTAPPELAAMDDLVLSPSIREGLERIVLEYGQRAVLQVHGLRPSRKLLFTGPPGVGKTMAAGALAHAVKLPMLRVELHGVIDSHLGETAGRLAKVFSHIGEVPAVYLFDEFDALGMRRGAENEGAASGEMRRVVNSLLQFIENDRSESFIVGATNLVQFIDEAVFRRFDERLMFQLPTQQELDTLVRRALGGVGIENLDVGVIFETVLGRKLGHADVCMALERVLKDHVLVGSPVDTACVIDSLARRAR